MKISEKMKEFIVFVDLFNDYENYVYGNTFIAAELKKIDELQKFVNSVKFLNETDKIFNRRRRELYAILGGGKK